MKMRRAATPRSTSAIRGSTLQKPSTTRAKILRRRSSSAFWKTGALDSVFFFQPCPIRTRAASVKSSFTTFYHCRFRSDAQGTDQQSTSSLLVVGDEAIMPLIIALDQTFVGEAGQKRERPARVFYRQLLAPSLAAKF